MVNVDDYLARIGLSGVPTIDRQGLELLQRAHMTAVPFENLHVFHGVGVRTDLEWSLNKIVRQRRGGWCFELNGAFAWLLDQLGFSVSLVGAAVLLDGPNRRIDHLAVEVMLDQPWLVDVGFGKSFISPLALNRRGPQNGGSGQFEFIDSRDGVTLTELVDELPAAQYRFRRVSHQLAEFEPASVYLQSDQTSSFTRARFVTRLLDDGPDRVTLTSDLLKVERLGHPDECHAVGSSDEEWEPVMTKWFDLDLPSGVTSR